MNDKADRKSGEHGDEAHDPQLIGIDFAHPSQPILHCFRGCHIRHTFQDQNQTYKKN